MAASRNHHFVPQFYLRNWCNQTGFLIAWWRVPGKIDHRPMSPAAVGYQRDLYSYDRHLGDGQRDEVEKVHFQRIDDEAPKVLEKMLHNGALTADDVSVWTEFLLNLRIRTPENVKLMKDFWVTTVQDLENRKAMLDKDERSFLHWFKTKSDASPEDIALSQIPAVGGNQRATSDLKSFAWRTVSFNDPKWRLLTSDRPLVVTSGLHKEDCIIALPITPTMAFVAFRPQSNAEKHLTGLSQDQLIEAINNAVVRAAEKFVFSNHVSDVSLAFLNSRMRTI